jgi:5'-3' exonuclease
MCILSGCDYLENLPGIGLGKAKKLLKSITKSDIEYVKNHKD